MGSGHLLSQMGSLVGGGKPDHWRDELVTGAQPYGNHYGSLRCTLKLSKLCPIRSTCSRTRRYWNQQVHIFVGLFEVATQVHKMSRYRGAGEQCRDSLTINMFLCTLWDTKCQ